MSRMTSPSRIVWLAGLVTLLSAPILLSPRSLVAQEDDLAPPPTWQVRLDRPDRGSVDDIRYVDMPPGWHITTGPAAIFWDPATTAAGDFRIESEVFLFDPGQRQEAFGIFFGGSDLQGPEQAYTYFLIREGGEFIVKARQGSEASTVIPWTAHEAIVSYATRPEASETAKNVLVVEAEGNTVRFFVNGAEVASLPRDGILTDGTVGLRVNHNLNLHFSTLDVTAKAG